MYNNSICESCSHFVNNVCELGDIRYDLFLTDDITGCIIDCDFWNNDTSRQETD